MITKTLLNKCLNHLNDEIYYDNVSYGVTNYKTFILIEITIWNTEIKTFKYKLSDKSEFNDMVNLLKIFIHENKQVLC